MEAQRRGLKLSVADASAKIWMPQQRQKEAMDSRAFETLYGGAAGGGKSDLLLGLARLQHNQSLLLRRTFTSLEDTLVLRSLSFFGQRKWYNAGNHGWNIPGGRRVRFGYLNTDSDVYHYQSAQFDLIGFDEITEFSQFQYEFMFSRARTVRPGQRVRIVACTNPGGEGNDWVMRRWAAWLQPGYSNPANPGELRWYKRDAEGTEIETHKDDPDGVSRTFIPARLGDNPFLSDDYRRTLAMMPEPYRSQLLYGDWQAGLTDNVYQIMPTDWVRAAMERWTSDAPAEPLVVGVDVAHGGADRTVLARRRGWWWDRLETHKGKETPTGEEVAALIYAAIAGGGTAAIDVVGIGASAYDMSRANNLECEGINFGAGSDATDVSGRLSFSNLRAESYWRLREVLDPTSDTGAMLPPDNELLAELTAPRWSLRSGKILVEPKDEIQRRLGRSPDKADAVCLSLFERESVGVDWIA